MEEYSLIRGADGKVRGLWLRDPRKAEDQYLVLALLAKHGEIATTDSAKGYRVVPNVMDSAGGCFVYFETPETPGAAPKPQSVEQLEARGHPAKGTTGTKFFYALVLTLATIVLQLLLYFTGFQTEKLPQVSICSTWVWSSWRWCSGSASRPCATRSLIARSPTARVSALG